MDENYGPAATDLTGTDLISAEWKKTAWGNLEANLDFLGRTHLAPPLRILEIGCGKGAMLNHLRLQGYTVTGIDVDADALAYSQATHPEIPVCLASGDSLPFASGSFDAVLSFDVFEHIKDSDRHLAEVRRVLKPGGHYIVQTPNKWTNIPFEILRHWKKYRMGPVQGYRSLLEDHCALHNYWQLRRRFSLNGFDTRFVDVPVVNDYFKWKMRTYFGAIGPLMVKVLSPDRLPQPLRTNFYAVAHLR